MVNIAFAANDRVSPPASIPRELKNVNNLNLPIMSSAESAFDQRELNDFLSTYIFSIHFCDRTKGMDPLAQDAAKTTERSEINRDQPRT